MSYKLHGMSERVRITVGPLEGSTGRIRAIRAGNALVEINNSDPDCDVVWRFWLPIACMVPDGDIAEEGARA